MLSNYHLTMSSNVPTPEIPKVISVTMSGWASVPQMEVRVTNVDPSHGTSNKRKPKVVKRMSKKSWNIWSTAMARGRAKARMRAKERALANKSIEINHIEPTLG